MQHIALLETQVYHRASVQQRSKGLELGILRAASSLILYSGFIMVL